MKSWSIIPIILIVPLLSFSQEPGSVDCNQTVESFCQQLWTAPNHGNLDWVTDQGLEKIRFGKTANDIDYGKFVFLETLEKNSTELHADVREAAKKQGFFSKLKAYLNRKKRTELTEADLHRPEWSQSIFSALDDVMEQVALVRTERLVPGYIRLPSGDTPPEYIREFKKQVDLVWSELFVAVWKKHPAWLAIQEKFDRIRNEYLAFVANDPSISLQLKAFWIEQLKTLRLAIPGANPRWSTGKRHWCGIDEVNAFYYGTENELTVCAGQFNGSNSTQVIAHEVGHSLGIGRRLRRSLEESPFGKKFYQLWQNSVLGKHLSCSEWTQLKKDLETDLKNQKPYVYDDQPLLERFVTKKLTRIQARELNQTAQRIAEKTVRSEIDERYVEKLIKKDHVLSSGRIIPNHKYLRPHELAQWPLWQYATFDVGWQFELFFSEELQCRANEKGEPSLQAVENAITEGRRLAQLSWKMLLAYGGRYSSIGEAIDEGFAQDIEEDLVDIYASRISSRLLKQPQSHPDGRMKYYLASISTYCEEPSFAELYSADHVVLRKFSHKPHSIGPDRRKKLLTPEIRAALGCR